MSFTPESDLERALVRAQAEEAARPGFYHLLLEAGRFVIGDVVNAAGTAEEGTLPPGGQLRLAGLEHEGHSYHLIFTTLERLQAFAGEPGPHLRMKARELFAATQGAYFMLNAGDEYGKPLVPEEIAQLLNASPVRRGIESGEETQIRLGPPPTYPHVLVKALKTLFADTPAIVAAHLLYIAYKDGDYPHPIIGVEGGGDWQAVAKEIGDVLKATNSGTLVDVMPLDRANPDGIARALLEVPPFYSRQT